MAQFNIGFENVHWRLHRCSFRCRFPHTSP